MRTRYLLLSALALGLTTASAIPAAGNGAQDSSESAPATATADSSRPQIEIRAATEQGKKVLIAAVALRDKPLENVTIAFFVERTFGAIRLGQETTIDDGTAAVPFPVGLPGDAMNQLRLRVEVLAPAEHLGMHASAVLPAESEEAPSSVAADRPIGQPWHVRLKRVLLGTYAVRLEAREAAAREGGLPRALWAPRAPVPLLLTFILLLGGVWSTYVFVFVQLSRIRKEGKSMRGDPAHSGSGRSGGPALAFIVLGLAAFSGLGIAVGRAEEISEPWRAPARAAKKKNPVSADAAALALGKKLYAQHCLSCHGARGLGDGPAAKDLGRSPGNLADPNLWDQSDGELYWKLTEGKKPMPTFQPLTTEEQRWQIVIYTRTLAPKKP